MLSVLADGLCTLFSAMLCKLHVGLPNRCLVTRVLQRLQIAQPTVRWDQTKAASNTQPASEVPTDSSEHKVPLTRIQRSQQGLDVQDRKTPKSVKRKVAMHIGYVGTNFSGEQESARLLLTAAQLEACHAFKDDSIHFQVFKFSQISQRASQLNRYCKLL